MFNKQNYQKEYQKNYRQKNKQYFKEYLKKYREKHNEILRKNKKEWYIKNSDSIKKRIYKNKKIRLKNNINFKIKEQLRHRLYQAIKSKKTIKITSSSKLLGCSIIELKTYLENQFKPDMSWDNYGYNGWHVDHIKPCSKFNLSNLSEQKVCFHYTNLQPLWQKDNLKKSDKYEL